MLATVLSWVGGLLGGPFAKGVLDAYKARLDATNNADARTAELAAKEIEIQSREVELQAQIKIDAHGRWYALENLFGYVLLIYFAKIYLWDAAFHLGSTDAVHGDAAQWASLVIIFWFGKRGFENVARILKR